MFRMKWIMNISKCLCFGWLKLDYCSQRPELLLVKPASLAGIAPLIRRHVLTVFKMLSEVKTSFEIWKLHFLSSCAAKQTLQDVLKSRLNLHSHSWSIFSNSSSSSVLKRILWLSRLAVASNPLASLLISPKTTDKILFCEGLKA